MREPSIMGVAPREAQEGWESFGRRWMSPLVMIFLRCVRDAALAYDLATETLAAARTAWTQPPAGDGGGVGLLHLGARTLTDAAARERVSAVERRRYGNVSPHRLTVEEQRGIARLADAHVELGSAVREAADELARSAPAPWSVQQIRLSGLIDAEPLPDRDRDHHAG